MNNNFNIKMLCHNIIGSEQNGNGLKWEKKIFLEMKVITFSEV